MVLKCRVSETGPYPKYSAALADAQRALGLVQLHAAEWKMGPECVGGLGSSAGGHLAVALRTHNQQRVYNPIDAAETLSCRPDFTVLVYPACLSIPGQNLMANKDLLTTAQTPPMFPVQAENDPYVESAIASYAALRSANVPPELHRYAEGGHGFELRQTALPVTGWPGSVDAWLKTIGILKTPKKYPLRVQKFLRIGDTNTCYGDQDEPESQRTS